MTFLPYERHVITNRLHGHVAQEVLNAALGPDLVVSVDETAAGYFAAATHRAFPAARAVFSHPIVTANFEGVTVGFVVFLEEQTLTLECHSFGDEALPPDVRSLEWKVCDAA